MSDASAEAAPAAPEHAADWPLRPWLLAGLLGAAGLAINFLDLKWSTHEAWRAAVAAFVMFGALAAAFTLEPNRLKGAGLFAGLAALAMAGLGWRAAATGDFDPSPHFAFAPGLLAITLAVPLFQTGFHRRRFATPYGEFHDAVWTDAISAGGALAFTGISWIVLVILSELFALLKIHVLRDVMREGWFEWAFSGLAFGAALGTIRNELRLFGTLRTIVVLVLSLLALPVAGALVVFLLAMLVSGPDVLWQATRRATPVLLACAGGAFVLANTILRAGDAEMPRNRLLRAAVPVLALTILPLTAFAAVSLGTRVAQHGLSPQRIWGLLAIAVACAYAAAYAVAVVRGYRGSWRDRLRNTNMALAAGVCAVALFLALPIFDFGAISASNQVGRVQSGKVKPDQFDFDALRWEFGAAGRRALARLSRSGNADIAARAGKALAEKTRGWNMLGDGAAQPDYDLRVQPEDPALRALALAYLKQNPSFCEHCVALNLGPDGKGGWHVAIVNGAGYELVDLAPGKSPLPGGELLVTAVKLKPGSTVEVRERRARYIYVDGKPIQPALPDLPAPVERPPARR